MVLLIEAFTVSGAHLPAAAKEPTEVKVPGAVLRYTAKTVPTRQRTPEGEIAVLEKSKATLTVERAVGYRRGRLPAGDYELRIELTDDKRHELVLRPVAEKPAPAKKKRRKRRRKESTASSQTRGGDKEPPLELRAPLSLSPAKNPDNAVAFELKVAARGTKLRILVRAGSTQGRATLRLLEEK